MYCSRCGTQVDTSVRFCPTCGLDLSSVTGAGQGQTARMAAAPAPEQDETAIIRDALKEEYELEKELGRGGMAVVYKGRDKQLEREVAIKVLPFSLSFDAEFVERFQREARTAGKLEHPNIIPIYRVGKSGRVIYFVMKFIRGKSLSAVIEARGAMPVPEAKRMLIEAARALGYAHKHGIVHRDIKPDNIMFDELGQAIVADFGIAKAQSGARLTGTGMAIGTPHYMSPEQARAQNLDGRSDIYSLGVVAYQALTGRVPFDGEDSFSIGYKHIMEELPTPPLETADQRDFFAVVQKMMAKKPEDRFQTAEELIVQLEQGGTASTASVADMSTLPTRAIEPMKPPTQKGGPPASVGATAPLPRASASMGKPADVAAAEAAKAAPPAKKSARPQPEKKEGGGKGGLYAGVGAVVVLGGLAGVYFGVVKPKQDAEARRQFVADSTRTAQQHAADSLRQVAVAESTHVADSLARLHPGTSRTPPVAVAANPPGTARTPATTPPGTSRTPTTPAAPVVPGSLRLEGVPPNATVTLEGQTIRATGAKDVPSGRNRRLVVTATGFQRYEAGVDIPPRGSITHTVRMQPTPVAVNPPPTTNPPTTTPPAASGAPAAACSDYRYSVRNPGSACYDQRATLRGTPVANIPSSCTGRVGIATIVVKVATSGDVTGTPIVFRRSGCPDFDALATAAAQDMTFTAARKGGNTVESWYAIPIQGRRQ